AGRPRGRAPSVGAVRPGAGHGPLQHSGARERAPRAHHGRLRCRRGVGRFRRSCSSTSNGRGVYPTRADRARGLASSFLTRSSSTMTNDTTATEPAAPSGLKRAVGTPLLFAFIVGDTLGAGIYTLVGSMAGD